MRRLIVGLALALISAVSVAQVTLQASANIAWVAPVNDSNGIPLAGSPNAVVGYNVFASTTPLTSVPTTSPLASVQAPATTVTGSIQAHVGDTLYVYVTACSATGCSGLSAAGTTAITIPGAAPGVPTSVTVKVTITS